MTQGKRAGLALEAFGRIARAPGVVSLGILFAGKAIACWLVAAKAVVRAQYTLASAAAKCGPQAVRVCVFS